MANSDYFNKVIEISDKLQDKFNENEYRELNKLVYEIYGISEKQEEYIEKAMN